MSQPTEEDLRRAKDNLLGVVSQQQRELGVPDPGGRVVEKFVEPILEKVARGPQAKAKIDEREDKLPDAEVTYEHLGDYEWHAGETQARPVPGREWKASPEDRLRNFIRFLFRQPEPGAELRKVGKMCERHTSIRKGCEPCAKREERFKTSLRRFAVQYGYGIPANYNPFGSQAKALHQAGIA